MNARLLFAIAGFTAVVACTKPSEQEADKERAAPIEAVPPVAPAREAPPGPGVQADGSIVSAVSWHHGSFEAALASANKDGKLVLADVGAYWCPPCHRLDEEVFTQPEVGIFVRERFVAMHVDADKGAGPDIVDQYHVQAYPTILVLDQSGIEKGRVVDFLPAAELMAALQKIADGDNVLEDLVAAVEAEPDDAAARYQLGHAYALSARADDAEAQFEAVMLADPTDELGLASQVLYDRAYFLTYKMKGDAPGAIEALTQLQTRFVGSKAANRAHRAIGRLLHELGRTDEAIARLDAMLATDPKDVSLAASYGWFSFRQKCRPDRALEVVEAAAEEEPDRAELHYLRAELLHLLARDGEGLAAMRKALSLEPESAYYKRQVRRFEELAR